MRSTSATSDEQATRREGDMPDVAAEVHPDEPTPIRALVEREFGARKDCEVIVGERGARDASGTVRIAVDADCGIARTDELRGRKRYDRSAAGPLHAIAVVGRVQFFAADDSLVEPDVVAH